MTRRERLERKAEKRRDWAGKAEERSAQAFSTAGAMASGIPFGQPVLIGHHSERRDRNYRAKIHAKMDRGLSESKLASHHESKASGLEMQLERSIFSDDENAIEALEAKAKACDDNAVECNRINKAWRKGGRAAIAAEWGEELAAVAARNCAQFSWLARKGPMSATSDRAEARRCRERIKQIRARRERADAAAAAGGVTITIQKTALNSWAVVTFAEKPDWKVLQALRAAGYHWAAGCWSGYADKLPPEVRELAERARSQAEESEAAQ